MKVEPYRLFFPIGLLFGLFGVSIWIPWLIKSTGTYPGIFHPDFMIGGFLLIYSLGFIATAIPNFTNADKLTTSERFIALITVSSLALSFILQNKVLIHITELIIFLFLLVFTSKRFFRRKSNPPPSFIFIGIGLLLGALGPLIFLLLEFDLIDPTLGSLGKSTFYYGFMLALIIGIGSRLIPAILGHMPVQHQGNKIPKELKVLMGLFILSFPIELNSSGVFLANTLRLLLILYVAIKYWKLLKLPKNKGFMYSLLWLSSWSMVLGQILLVAVPSWQLQSLHLLYISGFGLLTLMISTRVTLAHGGFSLAIEKNSYPLLFSGIFIFGAAIFRFFGPLVINYYDEFLLVSSTLWVLALIIWVFRFGLCWWKPVSAH